MNHRKQAVMKISEAAIRDRGTWMVDRLRELGSPMGDSTGDSYEWLRIGLKNLPDDCRVTGVSHSTFFSQNLIGIRVMCDEFEELSESEEYPVVEAQYNFTGTKVIGWNWPKSTMVNVEQPKPKTLEDTIDTAAYFGRWAPTAKHNLHEQLAELRRKAAVIDMIRETYKRMAEIAEKL